MEYSFIYNPEKLVNEVFQKTMVAAGVDFEILQDGTIKLPENLSDEKLKSISEELEGFGIKIQTKENRDIVEEIKIYIKKMVYEGDIRNVKISESLSNQLGFSYPYLSNLFSSKTFTSIENFYILVRIEKVKELVLLDNTSLSEIAHDLNFSSVPHLSNQFKKVTGLTITQYLKFRKK
ncbi:MULTISPECIES: helix-turn-helix domain-containing protein [Maribacter]|jgi:AraC-like DNA-binding protein|uniref:Transcriptional regulator, AraC family n=1 Tax=Maribacter stanieri TaxID=440514 RepID=A0A1I6HAH3_9FLAO|nr:MULTISPECIES: AraC family transcriptional regulator [Maribacter]SFR51506.1 transcriptional regulator, AraC family [Maribacter stanieri]|tara:strand:- start:385 stop:918 length:534 start_codon:yes stop_codon:yes gene_type:complete